MSIINKQVTIDAICDLVCGEGIRCKAVQCRLVKKVKSLPNVAALTCASCARASDNGGLYPDGTTKCPIEEHYALPKDGYCHLWEEAPME